MGKSITRLLTFYLIITFAVSTLLALLVSRIVDYIPNQTLEARQGQTLDMLAIIFWILTLTLTALTVFFNLMAKVRQNTMLSLLSFCLLPILLSLIVVVCGDKGADYTTLYMGSGSFLFTNTLCYLHFHRKSRRGFELGRSNQFETDDEITIPVN